MSVADRVLPWESIPTAPREILAPLLEAFARRRPDEDTAPIIEAYEIAAAAHEGQLRQTGESYVIHPVSVATLVAELGLDSLSVIAALLHDCVEDTALTLDEIEARFGTTVRELVDGLTKLDKTSFESKQAQQAATMRKMLVAMAKDWRVLVIKLCDRLHNMRTLGAMPQHKAARIAQETLDIYAPLAHRLGMQDIKTQLEELAFAATYPKRYAEITHMIVTRAPEREEYLRALTEDVKSHLADVKIEAEVKGRPKSLYSIYEKMVLKGKEFEEINDLVGIRLVVDSVRDCYAALGCIHATYKPVQGRFKDYIAMPKFNFYQSLHTTVIGPEGKTIEVQIRTREMHLRAELGIAAHWSYKGRQDARGETMWLERIVDWQKDSTDPAEFLESLKLDLEQDEVFVFTPAGDVVTLAAGATPVDFAYSVHTDIGHRCIGAKVNGRLAPLDSKLASGDTVEVFTSKGSTAGPSRDWLQSVATARARNKIRQWFLRERREDAIEAGREELARAFRKEGLPLQKLMASNTLVDLGRSMNYVDLDALYAAIGENHVSAQSIAQRLSKDLNPTPDEDEQPATTIRSVRPARTGSSSGIHVEGLDDVMVRLSRCCTPVPGDDIIGFVTRGRGVSVHRSDCANALSLQTEQENRLIEVEWDDDREGSFVVSVEIRSIDRPRLLLDITRVLVDLHVSILSSQSQAGPDRVSRMRFEFQLGDPAHLDNILAAIKRIDSVYDAYRLLPGYGK